MAAVNTAVLSSSHRCRTSRPSQHGGTAAKKLTRTALVCGPAGRQGPDRWGRVVFRVTRHQQHLLGSESRSKYRPVQLKKASESLVPKLLWTEASRSKPEKTRGGAIERVCAAASKLEKGTSHFPPACLTPAPPHRQSDDETSKPEKGSRPSTLFTS